MVPFPNVTQRSLLVACFLLVSISPVAARATGWQLEALGTIGSDFVDRGYSRSPSRPAAHLGVRVSHRSGWTAGLSATTVRFEAADYLYESVSGIESRGFVGWAHAFGESWQASMALLQYRFPEVVPGENLDYEELELSLQYRELVSLSLAASNDAFGAGLESLYGEISAQYPLPGGFDATAGLGYASFSRRSSLDYLYGHLGLARRWGPVEAELVLFLSNAPEIPSWGQAVDERLVVSLTWPFLRLGMD